MKNYCSCTILAFALLSLILNSCSYGNSRAFTYVKLDGTTCSRQDSNDIELFFENETVPFEYVKAGLVEVNGIEYDNESELIDHIKYIAWSNCADAVIYIKSKDVVREKGYLFDKNSITKYRSSTFQGIAVRYLNDSDKIKRTNKFNPNNNYFATIQKYKNDEKEKADIEVTGIVLVFVALLIGLLYSAHKSKK